MTARKPASTATEAIFAAIVRYRKTHGQSPTLNGLSAVVFMSRSGVCRHLGKLEGQGRICRDARRPRGIRVVEVQS